MQQQFLPNFTHGVLTDTHLITAAGEFPVHTHEVLYFKELFAIAQSRRISQLWILPGSKLSKKLTVKREGRKYKYTKFQKEFIKPRGIWEIDQAEIKYPLFNGRGMGTRAQIIAPGIIPPANALDVITDARELFNAVSDLQRRLNVEITVPIITAKKLLYSTLRAPLAPCTSDMSPFIFNNELDLMWQRELTDDERKLNYLHVYDKTHAYLSACNMKLGVGNYRSYLELNETEYAPWLVGLFKVDISGARDCFIDDAQDVFMYSPMLTLAQSRGARITVKDGYYWPTVKPWLEGYYKILQREIKPDERGQPVNAFLKACFRQFFGWLGRLKGKDGDELFRPDVRCLIISQTKANIVRNVLSVFDSTGIMPAFISVDSVGYLSNSPDHSDAIPFPFTGVNPKTGAASPYRHNFTLEAAKAIPVLTSGASMTEIYKTLRAEAIGGA
jgi:hypothetical protein